MAIALDPLLIGARRRRPRRSRCGPARRAAPSRVVTGGLARPVLQRPRPRRARRAARRVGDRRVRRRRARLRHRHRPPPDASCAAWRGAGRLVVVLFAGLATAGFAYEAVKSRHDLASGLSTAELGVAALEDGRLRRRRRLVPRGDRLPRVGQRPARQAVGAGGRRRAGRRHLPVGRVGHEPRRRRRRDGRGRRARRDRLRPAAAAGRPLRPRRRSPTCRRPLTRVRDALVELQQTSNDVRSPWLVEPGDVRARRLRRERRRAPAGARQRAAGDRAGARRCSAPTGRARTCCCSRRRRRAGPSAGSSAATPSSRSTDGQLALGEFGRAQDLDAAVARGRRHDHRPRGVRRGVRALRLRHRRQRRGRRRRVPQPGPHRQLPVGRRDRQRAVHEDDGPPRRRRHRHGPVRRRHAARLHRHGPPRRRSTRTSRRRTPPSSCCATST